MILRLLADRPGQPTAAVLDARTLQGSVESGPRSGYDGHQKRKGSKVHLALDTSGQRLAAHVSAANENERAPVEEWLANVQAATGESVQIACVDTGYNGEKAATVLCGCARCHTAGRRESPLLKASQKLPRFNPLATPR